MTDPNAPDAAEVADHKDMPQPFFTVATPKSYPEPDYTGDGLVVEVVNWSSDSPVLWLVRQGEALAVLLGPAYQNESDDPALNQALATIANAALYAHAQQGDSADAAWSDLLAHLPLGAQKTRPLAGVYQEALAAAAVS